MSCPQELSHSSQRKTDGMDTDITVSTKLSVSLMLRIGMTSVNLARIFLNFISVWKMVIPLVETFKRVALNMPNKEDFFLIYLCKKAC